MHDVPPTLNDRLNLIPDFSYIKNTKADPKTTLKLNSHPPHPCLLLTVDLILSLLFFTPTYLMINEATLVCGDLLQISIRISSYVFLGVYYFLILALLAKSKILCQSELMNRVLQVYRVVRWLLIIPGLAANVWYLFNQKASRAAKNFIVDFINKYYLCLTLWLLGVIFMLFDLKIRKCAQVITIEWEEILQYKFPHRMSRYDDFEQDAHCSWQNLSAKVICSAKKNKLASDQTQRRNLNMLIKTDANYLE
jgi:hypothetical protein